MPPSLTRLLPTLDPRNVVALGPRDADLAAHAVASVADRIVIRTAEALGADADALPAVDYPQPGGLSWPELESLTAAALRAPGCLGITVCIYNPDLDPDQQHARRIVDYVSQMCAHSSRWGEGSSMASASARRRPVH